MFKVRIQYVRPEEKSAGYILITDIPLLLTGYDFEL